MPYFQFKNIQFHYEEMGSGEVIIALHGLGMNSGYWMKTGVAQALAKNYRVVALDLRAHGLTCIEGEPTGYDVNTMAEDINALADHLNLDKFHLLGHSTGTMLAVRYAMTGSERLHSLILTNGSSSVNFGLLEPDRNQAAMELLATSFEKLSWVQMINRLKKSPGPLWAGVATGDDPEALFEKGLELMSSENGELIAAFVRNFYNDPDPKIKDLQHIACPTLVVSSERDKVFKKPSLLMVEHIKNSQHIIAYNSGHMSALEVPQWLSEQILEFLSNIKQSHMASDTQA